MCVCTNYPWRSGQRMVTPHPCPPLPEHTTRTANEFIHVMDKAHTHST